MKIALITDTHFGARGDNPAFNEFFFKFWEKTFFPYLEEHNITTVIHLGDIVDRRKFINFATLNSLRLRFIKKLQDLNIDFHVIVGNHDVPYRNTNEINAMTELFGDSKNITIYSTPKTVTFDGTPIAIIPWINHANYADTVSFIDGTPAQVAMGHFEISGFEMDRGNVCHEGLQRDIFKKFDMTMSGHFHHRSTDGNIYYLGNTYEMTWADYNDKRGFHIFDTDTRELEFIENPFRMFYKVLFDDRNETYDSIEGRDFSIYKNTIVKVVVVNKTNPVLFDNFIDGLYRATPLDLTIVEDFTDYSEVTDDDVVNQADDTVTILDKHIEGLELDIDKQRMKGVMREIYLEAQNLETA